VVGRRQDPVAGEVVEVTTDCFPDGVESDEDRMRLEVPPGALVEWEWGSTAEQPWSGRGEPL
jgi:hypothetical protein